MYRHLNYLKYVIRHKWFVLIASFRIGSSLWLAIIHDLSKFRFSEWRPYAYTFYEKDGTSRYKCTKYFNKAWLKHQHRNPHHWQHWVLRKDNGELEYIEMPKKYVFEMVADWMGAGRAITGKWEVKEWYAKNSDKILVHVKTRVLIDKILKRL